MRDIPQIIFSFLLFFLLPVAAEAGEERVLDKSLHLVLWGASLQETARAVKEQTGADILFYQPDLSLESIAAENVWLVTGRVTLGTVMETLARRFGFRFRVSETGQIEVSRGYGWAGDGGGLRFIRTPPIPADGNSAGGDSGANDPAASTGEFLREFVKPLELLGGEFAVRFEPYPVPGNPGFLRGTAVMPVVLADYLGRAVLCLAGSEGDYPPVRANPLLHARATRYGNNWEELLGRRLSSPRGMDIKSILSDVADQTNAAIILKTPPPASGRALPEDIEQYTLGRVTAALAGAWRLGKRVFLPCGGVVFECGAEEADGDGGGSGGGGGEAGYETDGRSREFFWSGLAVAGFDVRRAAERTGAEAFAGVLRREVFPGLWRDPACSLVHSRAAGRLVVVAPMNVVEAVAGTIRALEY